MCIQYIKMFHDLDSIVARKEDHFIHSLASKNIVRICLHKAVISR